MIRPRGKGKQGCGRGRQIYQEAIKCINFRFSSLAQASSHTLHLILYSEFYIFLKRDLKFHKLQVPQNLNLFQVEKLRKLQMQNSRGADGLQTKAMTDLE